ncbi:hypothetical protein C3920_15785 [Novacetimonas pomaceti]|uniref:Uncharacterized protein n=1 Tax=Novacetimonas pomaceti TaxID=2021998 RepID=A0ABX5P037_9PROT|nr:hypothetical protein C3920_15785 [Novacetimonas pomaceti]
MIVDEAKMGDITLLSELCCYKTINGKHCSVGQKAGDKKASRNTFDAGLQKRWLDIFKCGIGHSRRVNLKIQHLSYNIGNLWFRHSSCHSKAPEHSLNF